MNKGWQRLALIFSIAWLLLVCGYAAYEWQAPFYRKSFFFAVIPLSERLHRGDGADPIPVDTPFLSEKFFFVTVIPIAALWAVILIGPSTRWVRDGFRHQS